MMLFLPAALAQMRRYGANAQIRRECSNFSSNGEFRLLRIPEPLRMYVARQRQSIKMSLGSSGLIFRVPYGSTVITAARKNGAAMFRGVGT